MGAAGLIGAAVAQTMGLASEVQTTIVTLDREWATSLAQELRDHHLPTLTPASPARWREHFDSGRADASSSISIMAATARSMRSPRSRRIPNIR